MQLPFTPQPIPEGFVILGAGGSFARLDHGEFLGLCVNNQNQNWDSEECHWTGSLSDLIYAARIDSPIAILNGHGAQQPEAPPYPPVPDGYTLLGLGRSFQTGHRTHQMRLWTPGRDGWTHPSAMNGRSAAAYYIARNDSEVVAMNNITILPPTESAMTPITLSQSQIQSFPAGCVLIGRAAEISAPQDTYWFTAEGGAWILSSLAFPHAPGGFVAAPTDSYIAQLNAEHVAFHQENSNGPRLAPDAPAPAPIQIFRALDPGHRESRAFRNIPDNHVLLGYREDITFRGAQRSTARCTYQAFHSFDPVGEIPNHHTEFICAPVNSSLTERYLEAAIYYEGVVRSGGEMHLQLMALRPLVAPPGEEVFPTPAINPLLEHAPTWAQNHPPIPEGYVLLGMGGTFINHGHYPFNGAWLAEGRTEWTSRHAGNEGDRPYRLYIARADQSIVAANAASRTPQEVPQPSEGDFRDIAPFMHNRALTTLNADWVFVGFRNQLDISTAERNDLLCTWRDMLIWEELRSTPRAEDEFVICRRDNTAFRAKFEDSIYHYEGILRPTGRNYLEMQPIMEAKKIPPLNEPSGIPLHSLSYHGTPIANIAEFMNIAEKALIEQRNLNPLTNAVMLALTQVDPEPTIDEWVDKEPVLMGGIDFHPVKHSAAIVNVEDVATSDRPISEIITRAAAGVLLRGGLSAHFQYTEAGELLVNPENPPSIEQGYEIVKRTLEIRETALKLENYSAWTLGMLADQMERLFGDDFDPSQIMAQTSRAYNTYITSLSVYRSMWNERRAGLSFTHHKEAFYAKVEPEDKEFILDLSNELKLSVADQRKLTSYIRVHGSSKFQEDRPDSAQSLLEQVETRSVNRNFIFQLAGRWYEYRGPFEHIPNGANPIINADTRATMTREGTPEKMEAWTPVGVEVPYERGHAATRTANREAALESGEPVEPSRGGRRDRRTATHEEPPSIQDDVPGQLTNAALDAAYAQLMAEGAQVLPEATVPA